MSKQSNPLFRKRVALLFSGVFGVIFLGLVGTYFYAHAHNESFRSLLSPQTAIDKLEGKDQFDSSLSLLHKGNPNLKEIAITFDDGPHPKYLPGILKTLKDNGITGTFFMVGEMMQKSPDLVRQTLADGNEIGNHTMTHPRLNTITPDQINAQLDDCQKVFQKITNGRSMVLFRPPGMDYTDAILKQIKVKNYITVSWTDGAHDFIKKGDFTPQDPHQIAQFVLKQLKPGGIILLHDAPGTEEALPEILSEVKAQGYKLVKVSTLLAHLQTPVIANTNAGPFQSSVAVHN